MTRKSETVVVTGAAVFIGSYVVDRLIAEDHHVIGIDDLSLGTRENLAGPLAGNQFTFIEADLADGPRTLALMQEICAVLSSRRTTSSTPCAEALQALVPAEMASPRGFEPRSRP